MGGQQCTAEGNNSVFSIKTSKNGGAASAVLTAQQGFDFQQKAKAEIESDQLAVKSSMNRCRIGAEFPAVNAITKVLKRQ